jgi:L-amino acid N-acyltransferase YncA
MRAEDWDEVRRIFAEGIEIGNATFEVEAPGWKRWNAAHRPDCRLVAREPDGSDHGSGRSSDLRTGLRPGMRSGEGSDLLGWAALSPVSSRQVYDGVADLSIYIATAARGRGVGHDLLQALIASSERAGIWTLQAAIFPENEGSLRLHRAAGFRDVGRRERIGSLHGVWRDVLLLERRSESAGQ